jgi:cytosine/adenosine deaminase-related metal-dependent hydrolase
MMDCLTVHGWRSLGGFHPPSHKATPGREASLGGRLEAGQPSDLVAIDLDHLSLAGWSPESLALDLLFSGSPEVVTDVWIAGVEVVSERYHRAQEEAVAALRRVMARLRS